MSFTYDLTTDTGKVRLWINDTDGTAPKLTDAEIAYALTAQVTVGGAVVWCIKFLMAKLTDPNFTADWLTVDSASAFKSMQALLSMARQEFGIASVTATANHTYRPDSRTSTAPDFSEVQSGADDDDEWIRPTVRF